ncbi:MULTISPECIES: nitrite reductase small subunit NirD [unclassified Pseudoalteromonas]|uniref:nitrite reductase small subunit NirD n=1 Tax=unclassified Pseudoalteromonas TaxID=194690 RepID=UPI0025B5D966|nr:MULTISPECIES: nitrite reductase small subunit NirD [unclassified Pseudoalteromonas]MDN3377650.1 nitrite reductase small subunit NirD [Pseudoalteromonas sp. APC 3893]MDN3385846.1 nitrite reductase small subunit NirD [Pseudoalteromonas sp. APC 4017]
MLWHDIASIDDLVADSGVCALVENTQIALFYIPQEPAAVFAINNYDPIGDANVLSRGIIGSMQNALVVASPLYKQHFCLQTGQCIEQSDVCVATYPVKIENDRVFVQAQVCAEQTSAA